MRLSEPAPRLVLRVLFYLVTLIGAFVMASLTLAQRPGFVYQGF
jgi:hypothetical protein